MAGGGAGSRMAFLDKLLGRNPTRNWQPQAGLELVLDLDQETFAGIPLGEKAERIAILGPAPDATSARIGIYNYPDRGFQCSVEQGVFVEVEMAFADGEGAHAFAGAVRRRGRSVVLTGQSTESDLVSLMGKPDKRTDEPADDDIPAHVMLLWNLRGTDASADFEDGTLSLLWLGTKM